MLFRSVSQSRYCSGRRQILETLYAVAGFPEYQKVVLWPNADAGSDDVSKGIREFKEKNRQLKFSYFKNFSPEDYARLLKKTACCVGNSSSFIREGSFLGKPVVLIGDRQKGREMSTNCIQVPYKKNEIKNAIKYQLSIKKYKKSKLFGAANVGKKIAYILDQIINET